MIDLPNADDVTQENVVDKVKQLLNTLHEMSDSTGTSDLSLYAAILELKKDMNTGFERIDGRLEQVDNRLERIGGQFEKVDKRLERIDGRFEQVDKRFEKLGGKFDELKNEVNSRLDEQTEILRIIAQNTK